MLAQVILPGIGGGGVLLILKAEENIGERQTLKSISSLVGDILGSYPDYSL